MEQKEAIQALAALAQETRLEAFKRLVKAEPKGISAGDLARVLEVPQNTLSSHLAIMTHANLVRSERHGRSIIYRVDLPSFQPVMRFLLEECCLGHPEACNLTGLLPPPKGARSRAAARKPKRT